MTAGQGAACHQGVHRAGAAQLSHGPAGSSWGRRASLPASEGAARAARSTGTQSLRGGGLPGVGTAHTGKRAFST